MSTAGPSNSSVPKESKSALKKKAKAEALAKAQAPAAESEATGESIRVESPTNGMEFSSESPYVKELYKNIRNIKKKLQNTAKADAILAANPNTTLEDLLASRKINSDQKTQLEKKPGLQENLAKLEEQLVHYKKIDDDHQKRLTSERASLEAAHNEAVEKAKTAAFEEGKASGSAKKKADLLALTRVLRVAAARRQSGDDSSPESRGLEGILLLVYGGEDEAVEIMEKLFAKSEELVPTIEGTPSEYTYAQIHKIANDYTPYPHEEEVSSSEQPGLPEETQSLEDSRSRHTEATNIGTDPTIAHAGMTELDTSAEPYTNGVTHNEASTPNDVATAPSASAIDAGGAANSAGEANWEAKMSDSWVEVQPRDPAETENGLAATPAGMTNTQSWAEDVPGETPPSAAPVVGDGFHEVHHGRDGRGRGGGRGGYQGEGRGRGGRPYRGDRGGEGGGYRGRGGGYRGHREGGEGGGRGRGGRGRGGGGRGRGDASQGAPHQAGGGSQW